MYHVEESVGRRTHPKVEIEKMNELRMGILQMMMKMIRLEGSDCQNKVALELDVVEDLD